MNRRSFLALLGTAPLASYIPIRSYFLPPAGGWRPWQPRIHLYDAQGKVVGDQPIGPLDGKGANLEAIVFPATGNWGTLRMFYVTLDGVTLHGYFDRAEYVRAGHILQISPGNLHIKFG